VGVAQMIVFKGIAPFYILILFWPFRGIC